jgi:hypothetical protein
LVVSRDWVVTGDALVSWASVRKVTREGARLRLTLAESWWRGGGTRSWDIREADWEAILPMIPADIEVNDNPSPISGTARFPGT